MKQLKLTKDQIQKLGLSVLGFIVLVYVYFTFFLTPLNQRRAAMIATTDDLQTKIGNSKNEMSKASNLERQASRATTRYEKLKTIYPDGAPIAWFPPRMKVFFANHEIEKSNIRLESESSFKEPELAGWSRFNWIIELPQADFATLGKDLAELENEEPLLSVRKLNIKATTEDAQFQVANLSLATAIKKR